MDLLTCRRGRRQCVFQGRSRDRQDGRRDVPADLFQVDLPSPPLAESEGPMREPRVGMTESDVRELYGAPRFRVDYVSNGQPSSREIYQSRSNETFFAFAFVDGIMTEFENLGRMPDDSSFQGL